VFTQREDQQQPPSIRGDVSDTIVEAGIEFDIGEYDFLTVRATRPRDSGTASDGAARTITPNDIVGFDRSLIPR
jgi:hypothetical protein